MNKYLKLDRTAADPEAFVAVEYRAAQYVSGPIEQISTNVLWHSPELPVERLAELLRTRGWHQTDIGDELDAARELAGS